MGLVLDRHISNNSNKSMLHTICIFAAHLNSAQREERGETNSGENRAGK